eukprot:s4207_g8.t1
MLGFLHLLKYTIPTRRPFLPCTRFLGKAALGKQKAQASRGREKFAALTKPKQAPSEILFGFGRFCVADCCLLGKCLRSQRLLLRKPHPEMPLRGHAAAVAKLGVTEERHR